jgi:hypothetical protein
MADGRGPLEGRIYADQSVELAKKLSNPVANLIRVPLQNNWDFGLGPEKATRYTLNIQAEQEHVIKKIFIGNVGDFFRIFPCIHSLRCGSATG